MRRSNLSLHQRDYGVRWSFKACRNLRNGVSVKLRNLPTVLTLTAILFIQACTQSQVQQFKSGWIGGIDAFHAFNQAITNNPNIDIVLRARIAQLDPKFQASKSLVQNLVDFPPQNKAELVALLKDAIPLVHEIAGNNQSGNLIVMP